MAADRGGRSGAAGDARRSCASETGGRGRPAERGGHGRSADSGGRPRSAESAGRGRPPEHPGHTRRAGWPAKPAAAGLGVDLAALHWQRSGTADGGLEVAFVTVPAAAGASEQRAAGADQDKPVQWVLLRVVGDPAGRVLVYDRAEWLNFVDGVSSGEFDEAAD